MVPDSAVERGIGSLDPPKWPRDRRFVYQCEVRVMVIPIQTTQPNQPRYVVVTPARDEAQHIAETITSVVHQTARPVEWIIVDDGSTDNTGQIIDQAAAQHPWIQALHATNRGFRQPGTGVMETFYYGYHHIR